MAPMHRRLAELSLEPIQSRLLNPDVTLCLRWYSEPGYLFTTEVSAKCLMSPEAYQQLIWAQFMKLLKHGKGTLEVDFPLTRFEREPDL